MAPTEAMRRACSAVLSELVAVRAAWKSVSTKDLAEFNAVLLKHNIKPILASVDH
jgi:DNA-binding FrmR family transcriptional regulator